MGYLSFDYFNVNCYCVVSGIYYCLGLNGHFCAYGDRSIRTHGVGGSIMEIDGGNCLGEIRFLDMLLEKMGGYSC